MSDNNRRNKTGLTFKLLPATILLAAVSSSFGQVHEVPDRGMSMENVSSQYGEPTNKLNPVGQPPITRWIYPEYTVYFEYETVIHSVKNK